MTCAVTPFMVALTPLVALLTAGPLYGRPSKEGTGVPLGSWITPRPVASIWINSPAMAGFASVIGELGATSQQVVPVYGVNVTVAFALTLPATVIPTPAEPAALAVRTTRLNAPPGAAVTF